MKKLLLTGIFGICIFSMSCNSPIEWNEDMINKTRKKCIEDNMAEKFKAGDANTFCDCFVNKMKEKEMGMMDMVKNMKSLVESCGASFPE